MGMAIARLSVKVGKAGKASAHAHYVGRDDRYQRQKDSDLEYSESGNMPVWAEQIPNIFWRTADLFERKNGSTYREYEIALPRELTPEQRIELMQDFIAQEIGKKYPYQLAIHNPKAMDGEEQPHAHLMFNERIRDGIERDPEQYFKRYNSKNPELGGAKKDNTGKDYKTRKDEIKELRQRWEETANRHLEKAGIDTRIDMRSYEDQGLDRVPEKKLLPSQAKNSEIRQALMESRKANKDIEQHDMGDLSLEIENTKQRVIFDEKIQENLKNYELKYQIFENYFESQKDELEENQKFKGIDR